MEAAMLGGPDVDDVLGNTGEVCVLGNTVVPEATTARAGYANTDRGRLEMLGGP